MSKKFRAPASPKMLSLVGNISAASQAGDLIVRVPVDQIQPNPFQTRKILDTGKLVELAESMTLHGIIEPLVGRQEADGSYTLIAGERRLQAARQINLPDVPMVLRQVDDPALFELGLIENFQRDNLHPVDTIRACIQLVEQKGSQAEAARVLGIQRSSLANIVRLIELGDEFLNVCTTIPDLSLRFLRALLDLPAEKRLMALHKREREDTSPVSKPVPSTASPRPGQSPQVFTVKGRSASEASFTLSLKFRKTQPSPEDMRDAFVLGLAENLRQTNDDYRACSVEDIAGAVNRVLESLKNQK